MGGIEKSNSANQTGGVNPAATNKTGTANKADQPKTSIDEQAAQALGAPTSKKSLAEIQKRLAQVKTHIFDADSGRVKQFSMADRIKIANQVKDRILTRMTPKDILTLPRKDLETLKASLFGIDLKALGKDSNIINGLLTALESHDLKDLKEAAEKTLDERRPNQKDLQAAFSTLTETENIKAMAEAINRVATSTDASSKAELTKSIETLIKVPEIADQLIKALESNSFEDLKKASEKALNEHTPNSTDLQALFSTLTEKQDIEAMARAVGSLGLNKLGVDANISRELVKAIKNAPIELIRDLPNDQYHMLFSQSGFITVNDQYDMQAQIADFKKSYKLFERLSAIDLKYSSSSNKSSMNHSESMIGGMSQDSISLADLSLEGHEATFTYVRRYDHLKFNPSYTHGVKNLMASALQGDKLAQEKLNLLALEANNSQIADLVEPHQAEIDALKSPAAQSKKINQLIAPLKDLTLSAKDEAFKASNFNGVDQEGYVEVVKLLLAKAKVPGFENNKYLKNYLNDEDSSNTVVVSEKQVEALMNGINAKKELIDDLRKNLSEVNANEMHTLEGMKGSKKPKVQKAYAEKNAAYLQIHTRYFNKAYAENRSELTPQERTDFRAEVKPHFPGFWMTIYRMFASGSSNSQQTDSAE